MSFGMSVITQESGPSSGVNPEPQLATKLMISPIIPLEIPPPISATILVDPANPKSPNACSSHVPPLDLIPGSLPSPTRPGPSSLAPTSPPIPRKPPMPRLPPISEPAPPGVSILERLIKTCPVWLQLGMAEERAKLILNKEGPGIFLVRKDHSGGKMFLSVRLPDHKGKLEVQDLLVGEEKSLLHLEGSMLVFDDIFKLIAFYCICRDILPCKLNLPHAIIQATKYEDMEIISSLASEFWGSSVNHRLYHKGDMDNSFGNVKLWYINPVLLEEHCNSQQWSTQISRSQSLTTPGQVLTRYKRPPPLPPRPYPVEELSAGVRLAKSKVSASQVPKATSVEERNSNDIQPAFEVAQPAEIAQPNAEPQLHHYRMPPVPPRRRPSEKQQDEEAAEEDGGATMGVKQLEPVPIATLICIDDAVMTPQPPVEKNATQICPARPARPVCGANSPVAQPSGRRTTPIPPPRKNRPSQMTSVIPSVKSKEQTLKSAVPPHISSSPTPIRHPVSVVETKNSDVSLYSPEGGQAQLDPDSYSTSSGDEEADTLGDTPVRVKRNSTVMLDKAKQRLSMVNLSHIFTSFISMEHKLRNRIIELAQDRDSYFGNLVWNYRTFTLETMQEHNSSTEMLQEIRLMMTQLKNYLIQSAELQALIEPTVHPEEKLEAIIEAALYKCVLKPLREAVYKRLDEIHTQDDSLMRLRDNQQVVLATTTTDLGVTTSVPEVPAMEKIQIKLGRLHKEYSPEKKISLLLKTCRIIYDSMSISSPGKRYGADDFMPVLMYVLARSNIGSLMLDVEYMMELMDPALQLGEGSYYLTTTYGALEHIKSYDKPEASGQIHLQIQDSINRWERRRTLNRARGSRTAVQDFISVSFLEAGSNTKTLGAHPEMTALDLCTHCAQKFEVVEPESYGLYVLVDGNYRVLAPSEHPLSVKSSFHHSEPRKDYYFVYRPGSFKKEVAPPNPPESLI